MTADQTNHLWYHHALLEHQGAAYTDTVELRLSQAAPLQTVSAAMDAALCETLPEGIRSAIASPHSTTMMHADASDTVRLWASVTSDNTGTIGLTQVSTSPTADAWHSFAKSIQKELGFGVTAEAPYGEVEL